VVLLDQVLGIFAVFGLFPRGFFDGVICPVDEIADAVTVFAMRQYGSDLVFGVGIGFGDGILGVTEPVGQFERRVPVVYPIGLVRSRR
jgi:hypothetical protein